MVICMILLFSKAKNPCKSQVTKTSFSWLRFWKRVETWWVLHLYQSCLGKWGNFNGCGCRRFVQGRNSGSTVLFRPDVQGVWQVTPHVHLYICSDRDIMDDWTCHMFITCSSEWCHALCSSVLNTYGWHFKGSLHKPTVTISPRMVWKMLVHGIVTRLLICSKLVSADTKFDIFTHFEAQFGWCSIVVMTGDKTPTCSVQRVRWRVTEHDVVIVQ